MSIIDQKNKVMGNIGALNVITEGLPKFKPTNSFSSMTNSSNITNFMLDLVQSLIGYDELKLNIVDVFSRKLPEMESEIKKVLKRELKSYVSCGVNPTIPVWLKSTGPGVTLKLSDIDFFEITKIDPKSPFGFLSYSDSQAGLNSSDFNTFLYSNIELNKSDYTPNGGTISSWGSSTTPSDILDLRFSPVGTTNNNIVKINANSNYDNKTLTDFNNNFIDSISLFGDPNNIDGSKILNGIIDSMFGTVSVAIGKTKEQLKKEAEIDECLECILNSDENDVIDDNYFTFSNAQLSKIEIKASNRKKGIRVLETCGNLVAEIPINTLIEVNKLLSGATMNPTGTTSPEEAKAKAMSDAIDTLSNTQASNASTINVPTVKLDFILELIKNFMKSIINIIISPKLLTVFAVNFKILYGQATEYAGAIDFMKKNKNLIVSMSKTVLEQIVKMLLTLALKYISIKLNKKYADDTVEQAKNYVAQILTLIGVPTEIIRQIQGLDYVGA
jgi:hypothetical protein